MNQTVTQVAEVNAFVPITQSIKGGPRGGSGGGKDAQ